MFSNDGNTILLLNALDKGRKRPDGVIHAHGKPMQIKALVADATQHLTASADHMIQYNIGTKRLAQGYPDVTDFAEKAQTQLNRSKGEIGQSFAKAYGSLITGTNLAMKASATLGQHHENEDSRASAAITALKFTKFGAFWGGSIIALTVGGPTLAIVVNELEVAVDTVEDAREGETFDWKKTGIDVILGYVTVAFGGPVEKYLEAAYKPMVSALAKKMFAHNVESAVMELWMKELQEKAEEKISKIVTGLATKTCEESVKKIVHDLFSDEEGVAEPKKVAETLKKGLASHMDSLIGPQMHAEAARLAAGHASATGGHQRVRAQ